MFPFSVARSTPAESTAKPADMGSLYARAPKLRECGEIAVASIVKGLQTMAGPTTTIEGMLAGLISATTRDVVGAHRADSVVGTIVMKDLASMILVTLDGTLVHAVVELLCGGSGTETQPAEPRAATPIDQQFAQIIFTLAAAAVQIEWADLGFGSATAAKMDGMLTADMFGPRVDEVGVIDMTVGIFGLHGTLRLVLPPALLDRFSGEALAYPQATGVDPNWTSHLHQEIGRAEVALAAYLDAKDIPLGALAGLKVGQILPLPVDARSRATLVSDGAVLYRGEIGRDDTHYSLRIDELVSQPENTARTASRRAPKFEVSKG
jgi:flagellar motor switch protein FliM